MNTTLTDIITTGMNNPDCSFFVGSFTGQWLGLRYIVVLVLLYLLLRIAEKLAIEPLIDWLKKRFKKGE